MNELRSIPLKDMRLRDPLFGHYIEKLRSSMIPYQWEVLNDRAENGAKSGCLKNFRVCAGLEKGEYSGAIFQDSDLAKWLEAVAYSLCVHPDPELEARVDKCVKLLSMAQRDDGYLNTYFTIKQPNDRWTSLMDGHELYCAGHFIEAATAYYEATGKREFLDVVCRYADLIDSVFGYEANKLKGYPGHEEIELALVKLYRTTGQARYLKLATYFIDQRGRRPYYFDQELAARGGVTHFDELMTSDGWKYLQAHIPPREQRSAVGHAVRAMYLYCAMADIAVENGDDGLREACVALFNDVTRRKMYITGGIGSAQYGERFTGGYDLPNDSCYCETCASIGLALFALRMSRMQRDASYVDAMERALYNTVLSGVNRDGNRFFYVNPLEVTPDFCDNNPNLSHVKTSRQEWFDVACCPTNIARTLGSLVQYVVSLSRDEIFVNLYLPFDAKLPDTGVMSLDTNYPNGGDISIRLDLVRAMRLYLRVPEHSPLISLRVNGIHMTPDIKRGWALIDCPPDTALIELSLDVKPRFIYANPRVSADSCKLALTLGPIVYCFEQADNGENLCALSVDASSTVEIAPNPVDPATTALKVRGWEDRASDLLYSPNPPKREERHLTALPYYCWNNRGTGEMRVWMRAACVASLLF